MTILVATISNPGPDLVLRNDPSGPYVINEDGFQQPARIPVTTVETNMFIDGGLPTGLRLDVTEFVFKVTVLAATRASLESRILDLMQAVSEQLVYTVAVTVLDGATSHWNAYAGPVSVDSAGRNATLVRCDGPFEQLLVTIPVQPRSY